MKKKKVIICPKCGYENEKHMVRCFSCGQELYAYPVISTPAAKKTSIATLILSFVSAVLGILALILRDIGWYLGGSGMIIVMVAFVLQARYRKEDGDLTHFAFAMTMFTFLFAAIVLIVLGIIAIVGFVQSRR